MALAGMFAQIGGSYQWKPEYIAQLAHGALSRWERMACPSYWPLAWPRFRLSQFVEGWGGWAWKGKLNAAGGAAEGQEGLLSRPDWQSTPKKVGRQHVASLDPACSS